MCGYVCLSVSLYVCLSISSLISPSVSHVWGKHVLGVPNEMVRPINNSKFARGGDITKERMRTVEVDYVTRNNRRSKLRTIISVFSTIVPS